MRRIRALEKREVRFGTALAAALGIVSMLWTPSEQPHAPAAVTAHRTTVFVQPAPQGSSLAYQQAASQGKIAFYGHACPQRDQDRGLTGCVRVI